MPPFALSTFAPMRPMLATASVGCEWLSYQRVDGRVDSLWLEEEMPFRVHSTIWRAITETNRCIAVKIPKGPEAVKDFPLEIDHFRRASARSRRVVPYVGHGELEDGRPFLAMEMMVQSLKDYITDLRNNENHFALATVMSLGYQLLLSIHDMHKYKLAHRDINPSNLLLDATERLCLADFGLSIDLSKQSTRPEQLIGTLDYLSPEAILGHRQDPQEDIYNAAVTIYELLTGTFPYPEVKLDEGAGLLAKAFRIADVKQNDSPLPVAQVAPTRRIPPAFDAFFASALALRPGERFSNIDAALLVFERIADAANIPFSGAGPTPTNLEALRKSILLLNADSNKVTEDS